MSQPSPKYPRRLKENIYGGDTTADIYLCVSRLRRNALATLGDTGDTQGNTQLAMANNQIGVTA